MTENPTAVALLAARRARRMLGPLPASARPATLAEGIAAQRAVAQAVGADPPAGFKIGATSRTMQEYLGVDGALAGFIAADGLHGSGSTLSIAQFLNPGVECEIAVHLARDLAPGCDAGQAAQAVADVMAGIEIVERRYDDLALFGVPALVADQVFHAGAVLGTPYADWRTLDLAAVTGCIEVDGQPRGAGQGSDLMGGPMHALAWLANSAEAAGFGGLKAGQVIMLGSVTPPIWLDGPAEITVHFPPMEPVRLTLV